MRLPFGLPLLTSVGVLLAGLGVSSSAQAKCVPSINTCWCTYIYPCPSYDPAKVARVALQLAVNQDLASATGAVDFAMGDRAISYQAGSGQSLSMIQGQAVIGGVLRGVQSGNMLGVAAPLANIAFGASPLAGGSLSLNSVSQSLGLGTQGATLFNESSALYNTGTQMLSMTKGNSFSGLLSNLPGIGGGSFASPNIASHARAWLPAGVSLPGQGGFSDVQNSVRNAFSRNSPDPTQRALQLRNFEASTQNIGLDAISKSLQIRQAITRHQQYAQHLQSISEAARSVGDDWRVNSSVRMALSAIEDESLEAEALLLALKSSQNIRRY